ncbi:hypothetical protein ETB97_001108 [Aspergillus alliaceus]|uniref:Uncharacterized protein n=1 Tax=Petromyces alliaceus TaxID=209559 RepID=A0A5N7BY65_PETAA|nr:hypothetical protein BDV23DRAFT_186989 [Aspergillus alliaceus]KAF5866032.1 hypothetical protein ETB97_001108 [Aspergillus burnettii]
MSNINLPSVTIEDLQAFQAQHFPGTGRPLVSEYSYNENVSKEPADDDDGLGYYPDGVKRTLTDEQIKIFRHSEIHSILRERQLREEELAQKSSESHDDIDESGTADKQSGAVVGETDQSTGEHKIQTLRSEPKQPLAKMQTEHNSSNSTLDYDEEADGNTSHKPTPSGYRAQFAGRRIVSYED